MTLNVNISIAPGQSYGLKVLAKEERPAGDPVINEEAHLKPGECVQVLMYSGKNIVLEETPIP